MSKAYSVRRDGDGFAAAVERDGYTVLILAAGAERNEQEADKLVSALNRPLHEQDMGDG